MRTKNSFLAIYAFFSALCIGAIMLNFRIIKPYQCEVDYSAAVICKPPFEILMIILCYLFGRVIQGSPSFSDGKRVNWIVRVFTTPNLDIYSNEREITNAYQFK